MIGLEEVERSFGRDEAVVVVGLGLELERRYGLVWKERFHKKWNGKR